MKKIILSGLLSLPLFFLAQTNKQHTPQQLKEKAKQVAVKANKKEPKPTVVAGSKEYDLLKSQGKLANYQVIMDNSDAVILKNPINFSNTKTAVLGPCDFPPFAGSDPYLPATGAIDDTRKIVPLNFNFCFYGATYTSLNVYDNGNVQFSTNSTAFTSTGFPSTAVNMIAPFWSDGKLNNLVAGLRYGKVLIDQTATHIVISWDSLPYYQATVADVSKLNRFQLILTDGTDPILPPGKNVGFYYTQMQWTTGNASTGTNGFPTNQPGSPATVGANEGNGTDYFQMGRFGIPGSNYDGPTGNNDGVSWLNGKIFFFDLCPPAGANIEPVALNASLCSTVNICGNDTILIKNTFLGPEPGQTVSITANAPTLGASFSYSTLINPNGGTDIIVIVDGNTAPGGYHTIFISATDDGVPALTNGQQVTVFVDQASVSNLNGSIAVAPTLGACPGGVVSASVTVNGGTPDTYLWNNGTTTASTSFTTVVPADSLIYVTLTSGQCSKTIIGDININPVPVASITGNLTFCNGEASSTILTAVNSLTTPVQDTYTWASAAATSTLSSTNTETVEVNAGVYTVTITNQYGCVSFASTTVIENSTPNYTLNSTNAISGGSVYCLNQDTARIDIVYSGGAPASCGLGNGTCVSPTIIAVGTATTNGSTSAYTPFEGSWESAKHQYLIRASELIAAGVSPGKLNSLAFRVTSLNGSDNTFDNFSIKLKCVSTTSLNNTAMDNTGLVQVFGPSNITATVGLNTYNFTQPYLWDGSSNLLVDVCFFNQTWDGNLSVQYTNVGYNASRNLDADNVDQCPLSTVDGTSQNRPNMIFGNCLAQQVGSQFNVAVTPTAGVVIPADNETINIALPTTAGITCYTVTLTNPIGGCTKDTVICVEAVQGSTQATLTASDYTVCPNQTVTLTAVGSLASYTITDGVTSTTNTPMVINAPAVDGAYVYTLQAVGPCGGVLTDFTTTVNVISGVTIAQIKTSQDSICPGSPITLTVSGPILPTYTVSYVDGTGPHDVVGTSLTNNTLVVTPTVSATGDFQTYTLTAQGACGGPITLFYDTVYPKIGVTNASLTVSNASVCPGTAITLSASGLAAGLATYTINYVDGNGATQTAINTSTTFVAASLANPVFGNHTYTLIAKGACNALPIMYTNSVFIEQGISNGQLFINGSATPNQTVCPLSNVTLSAVGASSTMTTYTIMYNNGAGVQSSVNANAVFTLPAATQSVSTHVYTVQIQGPCSASLVTVTNTLVVKQGTTDAIPVATPSLACIGSAVTLTAVQGSFTTYTITYNNGAGNIVAPANTNPTFVTNTASANNLFTVTAQGTCGAPILNFIGTYTVQQKINLNVAAITDVTKCNGTTATLTAVTASSTAMPYTYNWQPAAGTNTNAAYTTSLTGMYTVTVNGTCANPAAQTVTVSDFANATIVSIVDSAVVCASTDLVLNATAGGGKAPYTFNWFISGSSVGNGPVLSTTAPATEGVYSITVAATDDCGFSDSDVQMVTVLPPCTIEIGNVLTPNNDGVNDFFVIKNIQYHPNSTLTVFDRWGRKVYENTNYNNDWKADGLNDATYFYVLDVPDDKKYNGFVQIITK